MRYAICVLGGLLVALILFIIDQSLVSGEKQIKKDTTRVSVVDFIRVDKEELQNVKERKPPKKPPPPEEPPPPPKVRVAAPTDAPNLGVAIDTPAIGIPVGGGQGPYLGTGYSQGSGPAVDGDVIPIVRIEPRYPRTALLEGTEGWVQLEFTILEDGSVEDVVVVASEPRKIFDRAAQRAVLKWKFKPRIVDGKPVSRRGGQTIDFKLDEI